MQTQSKSTPSSSGDTSSNAKPAGTTFDLVRKTGEVDGKAQWEKYGTLFMRAAGTGGVLYLKLGGQELEIAVFPRKPRR